MKKKCMKSTLMTVVLLCFVLCFSLGVWAADNAQTAAAKTLEPVNSLVTDTEAAINNTLTWLKDSSGLALNRSVRGDAGESTDWVAVGVGRYGYPEDGSAFLEKLKEHVTSTYEADGLLHSVKATEWQRISLAALSLGADPTNFGTYKGNPINLINDGTYNTLTGSIDSQGINGAIWGLIAMDSLNYQIPDGALYESREDIIGIILAGQLEDGGFIIGNGNVSDPDMTGMALQALAPYVDSDTEYFAGSGSWAAKKTVGQVVNEAVECLSRLQRENGGYASWGSVNSESIAQVIVALCALNIDPSSDSRFIKNGNTVFDALLGFYNNKDGGFIHSFTPDDEATGHVAGESNFMATDQARYALIAYYRYANSFNRLYDFSEEPDRTQEQLNELIAGIDQLPATVTEENRPAVMTLAHRYNLINDGDQAKITNRDKLTAALTTLDNLRVPSITSMTDIASSHWGYKDISTVMQEGLFGGTSPTTFEPEVSMTRAMFVTVLARLSNAELGGYEAENVFSDVPQGKWYTGAVNWAAENKIIDGVGDNKFAPDQVINRQEMAKMIIAYTKFAKAYLSDVNNEVTFTDQGKISDWAKSYVKEAQVKGLIAGYEDGSFRPQGNASRAEVATIFARYIGLAF